jgi:hypothetical protein
MKFTIVERPYCSRVRSQIASIVRQIQRFDFDRNLVLYHGSDAKSILKYEHGHIYRLYEQNLLLLKVIN